MYDIVDLLEKSSHSKREHERIGSEEYFLQNYSDYRYEDIRYGDALLYRLLKIGKLSNDTINRFTTEINSRLEESEKEMDYWDDSMVDKEDVNEYRGSCLSFAKKECKIHLIIGIVALVFSLCLLFLGINLLEKAGFINAQILSGNVKEYKTSTLVFIIAIFGVALVLFVVHLFHSLKFVDRCHQIATKCDDMVLVYIRNNKNRISKERKRAAENVAQLKIIKQTLTSFL